MEIGHRRLLGREFDDITVILGLRGSFGDNLVEGEEPEREGAIAGRLLQVASPENRGSPEFFIVLRVFNSGSFLNL